MTTGEPRLHQLAPAGLGSVARAVVVIAEEGDGRDAEDGDQGDQQGVLDERGTPVRVGEAGPQPVLDELVGHQHG